VLLLRPLRQIAVAICEIINGEDRKVYRGKVSGVIGGPGYFFRVDDGATWNNAGVVATVAFRGAVISFEMDT
jgi:hypothetical protein